jgi:hypothetical protein
MLDVIEVVDSPAESLKYVHTRNEQRLEASARRRKNRTIQFGKSKGPILSGLMTVMGVVGLGRGAPPPAKWHLDNGEA